MIGAERLAGKWVHSHEEDTDTEMVFRRAGSGYTFPPARGRTSFELHPDGSYIESAPGPTDRPEDHPGKWVLDEGERLVLVTTSGDEEDRLLKVTAVENDILRVRK